MLPAWVYACVGVLVVYGMWGSACAEFLMHWEAAKLCWVRTDKPHVRLEAPAMVRSAGTPVGQSVSQVNMVDV